MKLQDIKTIDELRVFSRKSLFYEVEPSGGNIREIGRQLEFGMFPSRGLVWSEDCKNWADNPLFDDWIEAFHFSEKAVLVDKEKKLNDCGELIAHLRRLLHSYLLNNIGYREQIEHWVGECDEMMARIGNKEDDDGKIDVFGFEHDDEK